MAEILQKAVLGAKKTWLLYGANLSYSQHQRYLRTLLDLELISKKDGVYTTTEKGIVFIRSYQTLANLLGEPFVRAYDVKKEPDKRKAKNDRDGELSASGDYDVEAEALNSRDV